MKKKISLPVMAVAAILLLGGCGTQMYDLSEDEENLVVQYSAHILAKYNIEQKDGMTAASSEETQETQKQDSQMPERLSIFWMNRPLDCILKTFEC